MVINVIYSTKTDACYLLNLTPGDTLDIKGDSIQILKFTYAKKVKESNTMVFHSWVIL